MFAIHVSNLGGVFVEKVHGEFHREWGEFVTYVDSPEYSAVFETPEYHTAVQRGLRIQDERNTPDDWGDE